MLNPTYLSLSRHNVYYFRFPLPSIIKKQGKSSHIKLSLGTRDPKQALMLAGFLEYHASHSVDWELVARMNDIEVIELVKAYFKSLLENRKNEIRETGLLTENKRENLKKLIAQSEECIIGQGLDEEDLFPEGTETWTEAMLSKIGVTVPRGSREYELFRKEREHGTLWYAKQVLEYNDTYRDNVYNQNSQNQSIIDATPIQNKPYKAKHTLQGTLDAYIAEMTKTEIWQLRGKEERISCLNLLIEVLGANYDMADFNIDKAREIKAIVMELPKNRSTNPKTRDMSIDMQIKIAGQSKMSVTTINKYLLFFSAFLEWAHSEKRAESNPFKGLALKQSKNRETRQAFKLTDLNKILTELEERKDKKAINDYQYWGTMIALYTGARLNEVSSLALEDVKQDDDGIWYFDINDEEECKRLKTKAAKRLVPIHSVLINKGFLSYLGQTKNMNPSNGRLLYELTYSPAKQWGRNLSRWFNERFLVSLGIKTNQLVFHSLRHNAISAMAKRNVEVPKIQALVGHEPNTVTMAVYSTGYEIRQLKDAIECLKYS